MWTFNRSTFFHNNRKNDEYQDNTNISLTLFWIAEVYIFITVLILSQTFAEGKKNKNNIQIVKTKNRIKQNRIQNTT